LKRFEQRVFIIVKLKIMGSEVFANIKNNHRWVTLPTWEEVLDVGLVNRSGIECIDALRCGMSGFHLFF
jgi:hypothetical protein